MNVFNCVCPHTNELVLRFRACCVHYIVPTYICLLPRSEHLFILYALCDFVRVSAEHRGHVGGEVCPFLRPHEPHGPRPLLPHACLRLWGTGRQPPPWGRIGARWGRRGCARQWVSGVDEC